MFGARRSFYARWEKLKGPIPNICFINNKFQVGMSGTLNTLNETTEFLLQLKEFDKDIKTRQKKQFQIKIYKCFLNLDDAINYRNQLSLIVHQL